MTTWWGQLFTQAVSFIVFVLILKRWAWGPVMAFLEDRRERIKNDLDRAEAVAREAEKRQAEIDQRLAHIEDEARQRIQEAAAAGRKAAEQIAEQARADAKAIRAHAQEMAAIEFAKAMQQVKDDVVRMTITATERLLREKVDAARHRELVGRFLDELEQN